LCEPWTLATKVGKPYQVFTPFWKACQASASPPPPTPAPRRLPAPEKWPASLALAEFKLEPAIDWAGGLRSTWQPGEKGAQALLDRFLRSALADYRTERDRPDRLGTSRLSPHLHFGEVGPGQIWHAISDAARDAGAQRQAAAEWYLRELGWREFAHHVLFHFPHTTDEPLRQEFARFPWRSDAKALRAWQRGRTGYPLVDAGMRELWHTGWMHNRVRMVVASFLVKHLLIPWQEGAAWFWDTLVDADLANNSLGWQWTAGCGADAAPFFRIFNPVSQGSKFDEQGEYVRRWVPELARMPAQWIHQPWAAPPQVLDEAEVKLGVTYPWPIVEHVEARKRALEALAAVTK
jgi:deoxyribodipyrimidine photo-lyase